jgi:glycosyltransferase involved in cell wall biosynthesis
VKCSVIIPTYNRAALLGHTLQSLTMQTLPSDEFEVLVVDDGSSDKTTDMVESFSDSLSLRYFFQEDEGWRVAKARNVGMTNAMTDLCVFIDSGILLHSGCLAAHVASHTADTGLAAVCGYVYGFNVDNEDAEAIASAIDFGDPDSSIERMSAQTKWLDIREEFYVRYGDDFSYLPAPWIVFWACNVSVGTKLLRSVGGFDEAFRSWGGEDLDLGYRLYNSGARFMLNRQASAIHCPHRKSFAANNSAAMENYRYMAAKYGTPIVELLTHFPETTLPEDMTDIVTPFNMNDIIIERGLPGCAEYLARTGDSQ